MAIPKRGSRSIVVDGTTYRWHIRRRITHWQWDSLGYETGPSTTFAVEHAQSHGSVLVVTLPQANPNFYKHIGSAIPVVPSQVAHYIALALAKGWKPAKPGSAFHMKIAA